MSLCRASFLIYVNATHCSSAEGYKAYMSQQSCCKEQNIFVANLAAGKLGRGAHLINYLSGDITSSCKAVKI